MKKENYVVTCPICGRLLFRCDARSGYLIEIQCGKCGRTLCIRLNDCILRVRGIYPYCYYSVNAHRKNLK